MSQIGANTVGDKTSGVQLEVSELSSVGGCSVMED